MTDGVKREVVTQWFLRARKALASASLDVDGEAWEAAVNRAYYAAFYAAKALLATRSLDAKKHSGVVGLFGETFVVAGLLPPSAGRELNDLLQARIKADYDLSATFTVDLVAEHVRKAEEFVSQAERLLREEGWLSD